MPDSPRPPRFLERLLSVCLPDPARDTVLGDLREEYGAHARATAPVWYLAAGLSVAARYAAEGLVSRRGIRGDLVVSARRLVRAPVFTVLATLSIAIGVAANAITMSLTEGVFLAPLPFPESERLGLVTYDFAGSESDGFGLAYQDLVELRESAATIERVAPVLDWLFVDMLRDGEARRLSASFLGPGYLELLGVEPVVGRAFSEDENRPGAGARAVLLSRAFWVQELGGDPGVVGGTLRLNGLPVTVAGVLPGDSHDLRQRFAGTADVYLPLFSAEVLLDRDLTEDRGSGPLNALVRIRPGATFDEARGELSRISERLAATFPESNEGWTFHLERLDDVFYEDLRTPVAILLSGAVLVFLLVAFNLAGLLLVRALGGRHESSVRQVLGAAPGRLLRLSLTETALVTACGGLLGLLLAWAGAGPLASSALLALPTFARVGLAPGATVAVLVFLAALTVVLGLTRWAPAALGASAEAFRSGTRNTAGRGARRARWLLVVGEVGFAFALVVVGGLLVRSFATLRATDMGFDPDRLMTLKLELRGEPYAADDVRRSLARQLVDRAAAVPGVEGAFLWSPHGIGEGSWVDLLTREGRWDLYLMERLEASRHHVLPGTMSRAGIRILDGRDILPSDDAASPDVALVSASLARRLWPGEEAVGKAIESRPGGDLRVRRVVGVVEDARHRTRLSDPFGPQLDIYYPFDQWPQPYLSVAARMAPEAEATDVAAGLRRGVAEIDPTLPLYDLATMRERMRREEARTRLITMMVAGYAALAALLASLGIYGVLAETVRDRTREIGVRLALGARTNRVVAAVATGGLAAVVPGALVGALLVAVAGGLVEGALYGVTVWDPLVLGSSLLLLLVVGAAASLLPALWAAAVDPAEALREG